MASRRMTLGTALAGNRVALLAGLVAGCQSLPEQTALDGDGRFEARPIITSGGDFARIRNTIAPVKETCDQATILGFQGLARFTEAFDCGEALFNDRFNELDGVGARVGHGLRFTLTPRPDFNGTGEWLNHFPARTSGPN